MTNEESLRFWLNDAAGILRQNGSVTHAMKVSQAAEILCCPRLTVTAPVDQIKAVLRDWDKGREVNTQDLINALAWRVDNQRREIRRLQDRLPPALREDEPDEPEKPWQVW